MLNTLIKEAIDCGIRELIFEKPIPGVERDRASGWASDNRKVSLEWTNPFKVTILYEDREEAKSGWPEGIRKFKYCDDFIGCFPEHDDTSEILYTEDENGHVDVLEPIGEFGDEIRALMEDLSLEKAYVYTVKTGQTDLVCLKLERRPADVHVANVGNGSSGNLDQHSTFAGEGDEACRD